MKTLKHLLVVFLFANLMISTSKAQDAFSKSDLVLNAGIGLGHTYSWIGGTGGLPLGVGVEYGITDNIGIGGEGGFTSGDGLTYFVIGAKGLYHFNRLFDLSSDEIDFYAGVGLYYRKFNFEKSGLVFIEPLKGGFRPGFHIGGRYYFNENIAAYIDLGNSYAWFKIGLAFKL